MSSIFKYYFTAMIFVIVFLGIVKGSAFGFPMTINAINDAGESPEQDIYVKFVYDVDKKELPVTTSDVLQPWTLAQEVLDYAKSKKITDWQLESAGNIWSSDKIVGEALNNLSAGLYRVSVVGGAFMYDSFSTYPGEWSPYAGLWWWQLHIQSSMLADPVILGDTKGFSSAQSALANSSLKYLDVPVNEGGSLKFWIWDWNSIDNSGSLTFDVATAPIPEPSTLILTGTGLFFLVRRLRRSLIPLN